MISGRYIRAWIPAVRRVIGRYRKATIVACIVLVVLCVGGAWLVGRHPDDATHDAATTIDVSATANTAIEQATEVDPQTPDTTIKWKKSVSISDNSLSVDGTITEEIDENQLLTGNLFLPEGWTAEYSTNARTDPENSRVFSSYDMTTQSNNPLSAITFLRINTGVADGVKPYVNSPLVKPMEAHRLVTDGKVPSTPILFENKLFVIMVGQRVSVAGSYTIDCFDLVTYSRCVDEGNASFFPTYLSSSGASATTTTKLGTGTKDISTPLNIQSVLDDGTYGHDGRLYLPGQVGNSYGVACVDLDAFRNCGFTSLGTSTAPTGANPSWLVGFVQSGSKIYGHANDMDQANQTMVCFDIRDPVNGGGVCSGWTAATTAGVQTQYSYEHSNNYDTPGVMVMDGTKVYWNVNYRYGNTRLLGIIWPWDTYPNTQRDLGTVFTCFDVVTKLKCSGVYQYNWPRMYDGSLGEAGGEYIGPVFIWKQNGASHGICYTASGISLNDSPVESRVLCHDPADGNFLAGGVAPAILPIPSVWQGTTILGSPSWRMSSNVTTIVDTDGHEKSYFAYQYGTPGTRGGTSCFDWNTQAHCSDAPWLKYWYNMNDANSADQGYAYDGSCMIGVSKQGYLWSYNTKTAESPCRVARTKYTATVDASRFYCDGQSHAFAWQSAQLAKSNMYDFEQYNVRAYDSEGGSLLTSGDIKDTGSLDLSAIDFGQHDSLYLDIDSNVWSPSPWANGRQPYASVRMSGDDVQYCYTTRAKTYQEDIACDITTLGTSSAAVFTTDDNTYTKNKTQTVGYVQPDDKQCFKDLRVSVVPDKTRVNNGDEVTYEITVTNKANPDSHNRGDIGGPYNPKTAQYEATLPQGLQFVSATNGGELSQDGTKIIWEGRSIAALASDVVSVVLRAPGPTAKVNTRPDILLAASTEQTLVMSAVAIYDDDVYQDDNTAQNQAVTFENNVSPEVGDLVQTISNPRAPASLHFTIQATDENTIASVELLNGSDVVGNMTPSSNADEYEISLANIPEGSYSFSARVTDDGTPSLTTTSAALSVSVSAVNEGPVVSGFAQLTAQPRAPASLFFVANISDPDNVAGVALLSSSNQVLGVMTPTATPGQYGITLQNYAAGTHNFKVRATDGASPALSTVTSAIGVTVLPDLPPELSDFTQTTSAPRAPASLHFVITAVDNSAVGNVQLLGVNDTVLGAMVPTGQPNQYEATISGVVQGVATYRVRATDTAQQPNTSYSSTLSISVDPLQVIVPVPTNTAPTVSDFVQTEKDLQAPVALRFEVKATDDSAVASVVLYEGVRKIGDMQATTTPGTYALQTEDYREGVYEFEVKVTDNNPVPLSTNTEKLRVIVARRQTNATGGGAGQSSSGGGFVQTYTPVAIRNAIPDFAKSGIESGFRVLATSLRPVSPAAAKALPYAAAGALLVTAGVYVALAFTQIHNRNKLKAVIDRFKKAERGRKSYIQLTSHYINTPIAVMKGTVELLQVKGQIMSQGDTGAVRYLNRLSASAQQLLVDDDSVVQQTQQTGQLLQASAPRSIVQDPAVMVPIAAGAAAIVLFNTLFIWSKKYGVSIPNFALQGVFLLFGAGAMLLALRFLRQQRVAVQAVSNELSLEQLMQQKQSQFIKSSGDEMSFDIKQLEQLAPVINAHDVDKRFASGLHNITHAVERLRYLDELSKPQVGTTDPIQVRVTSELVIRQLQELAQQKNVSITLDMPIDATARIDDRAYRQLLGSTVGNAVTFSHTGGEVVVGIASRGKQVVITVTDHGVGIAKEKLEQLFSAFTRASDTETFNYEGMGIDLYMDKLIVDQWGGTIDVASEIGKGTTVTIVLPAV